MKSYEEYLRSHDGWHEMVAQLHRDILAELELINEVRARQARWLGELNDRIAKLESQNRTNHRIIGPRTRLDNTDLVEMMNPEEARKP